MAKFVEFIPAMPLHAVIAVNELERKLVVITAYPPNPNKWENDFSRRKQ